MDIVGEDAEGVAHKHTQYDYVGLQKSIQQEWAFVHQVTPDIRETFGQIETVLWYTFIPSLFQGVGGGSPA